MAGTCSTKRWAWWSTRTGDRVELRPKAFAVLRLLAQHAGRPVSRGRILDEVWPGLFVSDGSVTQCIVEARRALGPDGGQLLRTLPKRGYILGDARMGGPERPETAALPLPSRRLPVPLLAMLPLRPIPTDETLATFGEALMEGMVGTLVTPREPAVISTNSTRHPAGVEADITTLAARLGADFVGSGTLPESADRPG